MSKVINPRDGLWVIRRISTNGEYEPLEKLIKRSNERCKHSGHLKKLTEKRIISAK